MSRSSFAGQSRPEKIIMANARLTLFTRQEIIESFYTQAQRMQEIAMERC